MICNSSPLICLSKLNQLELLKKLFKKISIPTDVKEEVVIEGKLGYQIILNALKEKWIVEENPKNILDLKIDKGERAAISLAKEKQDKLIIDDFQGIKIVEALNIEYQRTTSVILLALKRKIINKKQAKVLINNLIKDGYYISPEFYVRLIEGIEGFR